MKCGRNRGQATPRNQLKVGLTYAYSKYDGRQAFSPVEIDSASGAAIERINFGQADWARIHQQETSWFASDQWAPCSRLTFDLGLRFDSDTITSSQHAAPRGGFQLALTSDGKTMVSGRPLRAVIYRQLTAVC